MEFEQEKGGITYSFFVNTLDFKCSLEKEYAEIGLLVISQEHE